ncbi:hypothetical protein BHM03_00055146 [Ensete ventricosum]|nr:hypothetical protein BHM03_00055146 [Ensete ventricosum]
MSVQGLRRQLSRQSGQFRLRTMQVTQGVVLTVDDLVDRDPGNRRKRRPTQANLAVRGALSIIQPPDEGLFAGSDRLRKSSQPITDPRSR